MDDTTAKQIWDVVAPTVTVIVGIVGPALAVWVSTRLVSLMNIKNDAARVTMEGQLRDALHMSAQNGINFALQKLGIPAMNVINDPNNAAAVINLATSYVKDKNPEAIAKLGVDATKLQDIVASKIPQAA
jgi:hypothetical protein